MAGVLPSCRVPVRRPTTKPKADPRRWFAYPQIFDANETSSFEIRQRTMPSETKAWKGEGRGRRRYVHSRCAELHFRKAAAAAANAGGSPRASQCGFRRGKPCDVDKFGFGPKPSREERPKKRGIRDGRLSDGCTRLQHSVYGEGTHPQIIARLEMQMNCPSARPSVPGRPTRLLGNAC